MKELCRSGIAILLALTFGALPFAAAADTSFCGVKSAAEPLWMTRPSGGGVSAQSTCVADCGNGTSVSVINCSGTCTATDTSCPNPGYVTCNGVVTSSCPVCPPPCEDLNGTSCSVPRSKTACSLDNQIYECNCLLGGWVCPY